MLDRRLAGDVVLIGPAEIADRAEVDEADFQRLGRAGAGVINATARRRPTAPAPTSRVN